MAYLKALGDGVVEYPYSVGKLRKDNPQVSFPKQVPEDMLAAYSVYPVTLEGSPQIDERTQTCVQKSVPEKVGGAWVLGWSVATKTEEQIQAYDAAEAARARGKRNVLLAQTDWAVVYHTEKGTNIPLEVELYRQQLRDITQHENFPYLQEADWPAKPAGL